MGLKRLASLANKLDKAGKTKAASLVDAALTKLAQSLPGDSDYIDDAEWDAMTDEEKEDYLSRLPQDDSVVSTYLYSEDDEIIPGDDEWESDGESADLFTMELSEKPKEHSGMFGVDSDESYWDDIEPSDEELERMEADPDYEPFEGEIDRAKQDRMNKLLTEMELFSEAVRSGTLKPEDQKNWEDIMNEYSDVMAELSKGKEEIEA